MIKLAVVGDSLCQGFRSGGITDTHLSFPALIARAMRLNHTDFRYPDFQGRGGLPLNLEQLVRRLTRYGERIRGLELPRAIFSVRSFLDDVEDYWERGPGVRPSETGPLHHNLASWGFEIEDADMLTEAVCRRAIPSPRDDVLAQIPQMALYRAARRTLNPGYQKSLENLSQVDAAQLLAGEGGGIENLIFWLGSNNALGTVTDLDNPRWSSEADLHRYAHERSCNLWLPDHFEKAFRRVADRIDAIGAKFVFVGNVPHITIPPVTRGVSVSRPERDGEGYYEYYTRFWVWDGDFRKDPESYSRLTREDARRIDSTVDAYNRIIQREARSRGWHLVNTCRLLDSLAFRRKAGKVKHKFPAALVRALEESPRLRYLVRRDGNGKRVCLDTRYLRLDPDQNNQISAGGIFSLDGIHPTVIGYGVVAHEFLRVMNGAWKKNDVEAAEPNLAWWREIVAADELIGDPPENLNHLRELLSFLSGRNFIGELIQTLGGRFLR